MTEKTPPYPVEPCSMYGYIDCGHCKRVCALLRAPRPR